MKNIHVISTDKPSRLGYLTNKGKEIFKDLRLFDRLMPNILDSENQNIYITNDEEIKEGDWFYDGDGELCKYTSDYVVNPNGWNDNKKIILTTDQDLDGVQSIDYDFLEWFVKNPGCDYVKVVLNEVSYFIEDNIYRIIIPKEEQKQHLIDIMRGDEELGLYDEPKQETLEEFIENGGYPTGSTQEIWEQGVREGAKWQQEQIGKSEFLQRLRGTLSDAEARRLIFEQFKKK
jgi:hypothetical protein